MKFLRLALRQIVAVSLFRNHVDEQRHILNLLRFLKHMGHLFDVVAVKRAEVAEAQRFKHLAARRHGFDHVLRVFNRAGQRLADQRNAHQLVADALFAAVPRRARAKVLEIFRQRAHVFGNGHFVVVEYHDQPRVPVARVVHRLVAHAARQRAVADNRHHMIILVVQISGARQPQRHRNGRGRMTRIKQIVLALLAARKTAHAVIGAQGFELLLSAGEQLMRVNLMTDVENQLIRRAVERPVQRNRQFNVA